MGYTHYWRRHREFTTSEWTEILNYTKAIVKVARVPLANAMGDKGTKPTFNKKEICFNGVDEDAHETFHLTQKRPEFVSYIQVARQEREGVFAFCKTAYKPYDPIVVSILVKAHTVAPDAISISSDGGEEALVPQFDVP